MLVNGLLTFQTVENRVFRESMRYKSVSLSTFMMYLPRLTELVEQKLAKMLPDKISLVLDGCSSYSNHYTAIYATYPTQNAVEYEIKLSTLSPLNDESTLDANEHIEFITFILDVYGKDMSNDWAMIRDNISVNKSVSTKLNMSLIGCASHRLNLAVKDLLHLDEPLLNKLNRLILKLGGSIIECQIAKSNYSTAKITTVDEVEFYLRHAFALQRTQRVPTWTTQR